MIQTTNNNAIKQSNSSSMKFYRYSFLTAICAAGIMLLSSIAATPAYASPADDSGGGGKDRDNGKQKVETKKGSDSGAGSLWQIRQAQALANKDKGKDKPKPKPAGNAGKPKNPPKPAQNKETQKGPQKSEQPKVRGGNNGNNNSRPQRDDDRSLDRKGGSGQYREPSAPQRFIPREQSVRGRDDDRSSSSGRDDRWGRDDNDRRVGTPQHRSDNDRWGWGGRWDRDDRYERNSRVGIHFDFDDWDLRIHFGNPGRGFWYRDCRPAHRCHRHDCRYCCPPAPRYHWDCSPGHRCGRHECHFCHPIRIYYQPVCRVDHRCGLVTCSYCHPPVVIHYDTSYFERTLMRGWDEIAMCEYRDARDTFECLIKMDRYDPRPRIGLAIAQGLRGHESSATDEMRDAVDLNPGALRSVSCDDAVERQIVDLLYVFEDRAHEDYDDEDELFMVASLRTILGDEEGALRAIRAARRYGDNSSEACKLDDFLTYRVELTRDRW